MLKFLQIMLICLIYPSFVFASSSQNRHGEEFMETIGGHVIETLTNKKLNFEQRKAEFRKILETKFDIHAIGKFVLGRYWKRATPSERQEFLRLFKETTLNTYATRFQEYTSESFDILGSRVESDGGIIVMTQISRPNGQIIPIEWKLYVKNGHMLIYDVILEGISMSITQRSEYASVIQQGGGQIQALLDALKDKLSNH